MDKKKAVGYVRVSDTELLPNYDSKQSQVIKDQVESDNDCDLIEIYADSGVAREDNKLDSYGRMMQDAEAHKFDRIYTVSSNRIMRNTEKLNGVLDRLHELGIEVVFLKENIRTTDTTFTIARIMNSIGNGERKIKVAGYARLGANPMTNSIASEMQFLKDEVAKHPEWELVELYADQGTFGKGKKRYDFERMLNDADEHKFDCIIVKNMRRFSQDMVEALRAVHRLSDAEVMVYFINDDMKSTDEGFNIQYSIMCAVEDKKREVIRARRKKNKE